MMLEGNTEGTLQKSSNQLRTVRAKRDSSPFLLFELQERFLQQFQ